MLVKRTAVAVVAAAVTAALLSGIAVGAPAQAEDDPVRVAAVEDDVMGCEKGDSFNRAAADRLVAGSVSIGPYPAVRIPTDGNLNWAINPYRHPSWEVRYRTLRWLRPLILGVADPTVDAVTRARYRAFVENVVRDFLRDNPRTGKKPLRFTWDAGTAVSLRASFLLCARDALGGTAWLDRAITEHGRFLHGRWAGAWNHGTMEAITLYRIGCRTKDSAFRREGRARLVRSFSADQPLGPVLDAQGATNEQSVGYADYQHQLWNEAIRLLKDGGDPVPAVLRKRVAKLPEFLTAATQPDGTLVQLGDTYADPAESAAGTTLEYAVSRGQSGPRPTKRVWVYQRGYVFGHSGWGERRPFEQESFYSLRFGAPRQVHGHVDHTAFTYFARGIPMLVDSGHTGYKADAQRAFLQSAAAHNVLEVVGVKQRDVTTKLTRKVVRGNWQTFGLTDRSYGFPRTRNVLVAQGPDIALVYDRTAARGKKRTFRQLWHLGADMTVTRKAKGVAVATPKGGADARLWMIPVALGGARPRTAVVTGRTSPRQGWVSDHELTRRPAPVVTMTRRATAARMLTVFVPTSSTAVVRTAVRNVGKGAKVLTVTVDGTARRFRIGAQGTLTRL
ncbi:hypothetical protein GCM10009547_40140 [Sporichthya brevicatena]|uniref:Heparinase II/III-like C-terminal domain-containing protein n=1 Tax=Sporichthya brevicatena TaxID=171442 RepID=A0ABN1H8B9_9ACTN